jgi:hypothetical protein
LEFNDFETTFHFCCACAIAPAFQRLRAFPLKLLHQERVKVTGGPGENMLPRISDMPVPASLHTEFMAELREWRAAAACSQPAIPRRSQAELVDGQTLLHPAQALLVRLRSR